MLGIVLINYDSEIEIINYIGDELSKVKNPNKVVIVNNSYSKESHQLLEDGIKNSSNRTLDEDLFLITKKENLGYGKANNYGAQFLKDKFGIKFILFSNSDIKFKDCNVVDTLLKKLIQLNDVAAIGPRVIDPNGNDQSPHKTPISFARYVAWQLFPFLKGKFGLLQKGNKNEEIKLSEGYTYWVSGCFLLVKSKAFFEADMFDENVFMYSEERILSERLRNIDKRMYFYPDVGVYHFEDYSEINGKLDKKKNIQLSKMYYYKNYRNVNKYVIAIFERLFRKPT